MAFHHEAVFYRDDDEYLSGTLPHIRMDAAGAALVAVPAGKRHLLEQALGTDAERVTFVDMEQVGRNPACIIPVWRDFLSQAGSGPLVGVGEPVWPGRSDAELAECSRHESLINLAFGGGRAWRLLCRTTRRCSTPIPARRVPQPPAARARQRVVDERRLRGPARSARAADSLPAPTDRATELPFGAGELALVRRFVTDAARQAGCAGDRLEDLVLAVNELAANTVRHGGGAGVVAVWADEDTFVCEVADSGHIADPFAGRSRPSNRRDSGRGLWMVNHLCDLVQVRSTKEGNVVRLHMSLA